MAHEPQQNLRLWWVAAYHDGTTIYESEQAGEVSSEDIDRGGLKRFALVDQDGVERFAVDFPEGPDPKLVYRRRSFALGRHALPEPFVRDADGREIPNPECPEHLRDRPEWLRWEWTYLVGQHHADGRLDLWGMNAGGAFEEEPDALRCVTGHEAFGDEIEWTAQAWGPLVGLAVDFDIAELVVAHDQGGVLVRLPARIVPPVVDGDGIEIEPERLDLTATVGEVVAAVNAAGGPVTARAIGANDAVVRPSNPERVSDVELASCELFGVNLRERLPQP